ncbi:MAG: phosphate acyltransferase PlsX [Bacillota bacterium]
MKIAVDAMGGDFAPGVVVSGALEACREYKQPVILVGDEAAIHNELNGYSGTDLLEIVHAPEVISNNESPAVAVRRKKNSSIVRSVSLVKEGEAAALVSAGSTGGVMAAALLGLGRIKGIDRPAIVSIIPSLKGGTVLLDVGANVDCKPYQLVQFAIMGSLYAEKVMGISFPRVALLSNGEEDTKGNELTLAAYPLLKMTELNFIGNAEGRDIFNGTVDVMVCDGFVGNVVLKTGEGLASALIEMVKEEVNKNMLAKLGALIAVPALKNFRRRLDYAEYGGAPLLGVNGIAIICHGSSSARAIKNAIRTAREAAENNLIGSIRDSVQDGPRREVGS